MSNKLRYIGLGIGWYSLSQMDQNQAKNNAYQYGFELSQHFKQYPVWDKYMEPFMVNQFAFLFCLGNSFINGMISDNEHDPKIEESLEEIKKEIVKDKQ